MKKIFSAFLLMTMMVASVGSFVSCSDIEESIAAVDEATKDNAASIKDLEGKIAALQTALQTAQSEAAAAKAEANAAKQAAATAKAEAIAAALAEIEKVNGDVDAVNAEIKKINDALAGCATKEAVELLQATIDEYKAITDENAEAIAALEEALAALGENVTPEQLAEVVAKMTAIDQALVAFQNRLQSVSYVPEWVDGPTAVLFAENEDYGYVHMSYEVAPAAYASKITAENTKLVGVALKETKSVEVEEHDVKILNADPETGIVEVIAYVGVDSEIWTKENAAVALRVVAEDAQFTSAYENVKVLGATKEVSINDVVYFGTYNEDGDFTTGNITHNVAYNTAVAESEVALFEGLVARVNVPGFFEYLTVEEAAEMFGIEIEVTEKLSSYATKYFETTNAKYYDLVEDAKKEKDTPAFVVANDQSLDITVKFNETVVNYLTDNDDDMDLTDLVNKTAKAELKPGFFQVNGKKSATFAGLTATYNVTGLEKTIELVLNNDETLNIEWSTENYTNKSAIVVKDIDVTGGDARHLLGQECTMTAVDEEGNEVADAPVVKVKFISVDNADVTVALTEWPEEAAAYTYTYEGTYADTETAETKTTVKVTFDLTVAIEAAPESIGEVPASAVTVALVKSGVEVEADETPWPATTVDLTGVVEKILPYYKEYFASEKKAKEEIIKKLSPENGVPVAIRVANATTGELGDALAANATYKYSVNTSKVETSAITIPYDVTVYNQMKKQYVQFSFDVDFFGIVATVTADCAKVSDWAAYVAPTLGLETGKYNPSTLKGANPFEWLTNSDFWDVTVGTTTTRNTYNYVSVTQKSTTYEFVKGGILNLADYINIANPDKLDLSGYQIVISATDAPYYGAGTAADPYKYYYQDATYASEIPFIFVGDATTPVYTYGLYVPATAADVAVSATDAITHVGQNVARTAITASRLADTKLNWNNSNANAISLTVELVKATSSTEALTVKATLADGTANPAYIDAMPVNFATTQAIKNFEIVGTDVAYEYEHGKDCEINLAKHIKVTDLFDKQVNNPYGDMTKVWTNWTWKEYADADKKVGEEGEYVVGTDTDFFQVYGQNIAFVDLKDAKGEIRTGVKIDNNKGFKLGTDYSFETDPTKSNYGKIILNSEEILSDLNGELEFTVRVELSYMNDGYSPLTKNITVKVVNAQ